MVAHFITCIIALLWLLHRATRLLKIPAPVLINILGIDIPDAPKVTIDNVTSTSVSLHWNPPERALSIVKYILQVDGRRAGQTERSDAGVTLKDLEPDRAYTISVLAVNPSNYRSHAATVQIYTKKSDDEPIPLITGGIIPRTDETSSVKCTSGQTLRNRASTRNLGNRSKERKKKEKSVYTIESLTSEVESVQLEINEVLAAAAQNETEFNSAEAVLLQELDQLKERKKIDDHQRFQIKSEAKALEDSKRGLETAKAKAERRFKELQDELNRKSLRQKQWSEENSQSRETIGKIDEEIALVKDQSQERMESLRHRITECQTALTALEDETRTLSAESRRAENKKSSTLKALAEIHANEIIQTEVVEQIITNEHIDQQLKDSLKAEAKTDKDLEEDWQRVQKELEMRYLNVKERYEEAYRAYYEATAKYDEEMNKQQRQNNVVLDSLTAATVNRSASGNRRSRSQKIKNKSLPMNMSDESLVPISQHHAVNSPAFRSTTELYHPPSGLSLDTAMSSTTSLFHGGAASMPGSHRGSGDSAANFPDNDNVMSPDVDRLLPSNLFANDEVRELRSTNLFDDDFPLTEGSRPSGSILGNALEHSEQRAPSFGSGSSPKPSVLSIRDQYTDSNSAVVSPVSPQHFPLFQKTGPSRTPFSPNGTTPPPDHHQSPPNTAKKLSSMFFFGRRSDGHATNEKDSIFHPTSSLGDTSSVHSGGEIGPIGSRRRTGSYSSSHSNPLLGPWNPREAVNPADNSSLLLAPSHSHNGSTVSLESSKFGVVLNGNRNTEGSSLWKQQSPPSTTDSMPQLLVEDDVHDSGRSVDSKESNGSVRGSKFSKGFAGLFSSNNSPNERAPINTEKSIASLFGKSDDEDNRENIIQKSMRSFSVRKSSTSSTSSSHNGKFKVRSLSFFGGKKEAKDDNNEAIVEEDDERVGLDTTGMDIREFLAEDRDDDNDA